MKNVIADPVTMFGSTKTTIQWIWGRKDQMPHFAMRKFIIEPGGEIGIHGHPEEHEILILSGIGLVYNDSGQEFEISPNDALYVPPHEIHGYKNTGSENLEFLCIIPLL
ncbi:cupin domain-containing protein [Candidatus Hodarchaeum mangrovi]